MEKFITVNNKRIVYHTYGEGISVVLLHGFAEDHDVWRYQVQALEKKYKLIIPDLPGSGKSALIEDMSMSGMAGCLHQIIEAELPPSPNQSLFNRIIMIGHSMGGYITLAFAEKYPALLIGFGLFHSTVFPDSEEKKNARRRSITFIQTNGSYEFIKQSTPNLFTAAYRIKNSAVLSEMISRYSSFDPIALVAYYEAMILRPDRTSLLQSFNKPILYIIGKEDKAISFEDSMKQCHIPQQSNINILACSAHMGMWEEKEESNSILLDFLEQVTD